MTNSKQPLKIIIPFSKKKKLIVESMHLMCVVFVEEIKSVRLGGFCFVGHPLGDFHLIPQSLIFPVFEKNVLKYALDARASAYDLRKLKNLNYEILHGRTPRVNYNQPLEPTIFIFLSTRIIENMHLMYGAIASILSLTNAYTISIF